jgi:hypothetical protein
MAPIPFDRHGVPGTIELVDDFVTFGADVTITSAGQAVASDLNWRAQAIAADAGTAAIIVGESDHQGIMSLAETTTSSTTVVSLKLGRALVTEADEAFFLDTNGLYVATVLRMASLTATEAGFGLGAYASAITLPNSGDTNVIHWVYDNSDTASKWIAQVNGASTTVEEACAFNYVANDWVLLEIAADTSGVTFRITTEDDTQTIVIDGADSSTGPIVALRPEYLVSAGADGTAGVIQIDAFALRYLRRQPLTASWLGQ